MIIDFHTHVFPNNLAGRAVEKLSISGNIRNYTDGTHGDLVKSMQRAGIDYSVLLPVATKPTQTRDINRIAIEENEYSSETGIISFGAIHPDNEDYKEILKELVDNHVKGVKIHPVFTRTYIDNLRYERIISAASELGLIILTHGGYDISYPGADFVTPNHIVKMINDVMPEKMVLAHMGGWGCYDQVLDLCAGRPEKGSLYLDTSFSYYPLRPSEYLTDESRAELSSDNQKYNQLSFNLFCQIVRTIGADHVLFGTDSPWSDQKESVDLLRQSGLNEQELSLVLYGNAQKLLNL